MVSDISSVTNQPDLVASEVARDDPVDVAVVVVLYEGADFIADTLRSCQRYASGAPLYVIDNASTDGGAELVSRCFPDCHVLYQERNLGFAAGNNVGMRTALADGARHVFLLNQDAELLPDTLRLLRDFLDAHPIAAAVQPAIRRDDGLVNSLGNPLHFLGFSAAGGNGLTVEEATRDPALSWLRSANLREGVEVPVCSGAAVMFRGTALRTVGHFMEELFLYHEDVELSLRFRANAWTVWLLPTAHVVHHYEFNRSIRKWYFMERNRLLVLLTHMRLRTLALFALPLLMAELLVWLLAVREGFTVEKLKTYRYFLSPTNLSRLRRRRAELTRTRRKTDRDVLAPAIGRFPTVDPSLAGLSRPLNAGGEMLWRLLYRCIRW
jgi:GT2 family glycosyltransferase